MSGTTLSKKSSCVFMKGCFFRCRKAKNDAFSEIEGLKTKCCYRNLIAMYVSLKIEPGHC